MLKNHLAVMLAGLALSFMLTPPAVTARPRQDSQLIEKVKADVAAIGVGARVSVKMRDKVELIGYLSQVGENDFIITKAKAGTKQTIAYAEVSRVKIKNEKRISTAGKILFVIGVLWILGLISTGGGD